MPTLSPASRLLGEFEVPHDFPVGGTPVGGLSGIDRDLRSGRYVILSNDQSQHAPARFYEANVDVDENGLHDVRFTNVNFFRRPDGNVYPSQLEWAREQARYSQPDRNRLGTVAPENIRVDRDTGNVVWAHKGLDHTTPAGHPMVIEPALRVSARDGSFVFDLSMPEDELINEEPGPLKNRAFAGFTFARNGRLVVTVMNPPYEQDGPASSRNDGGLARITVQDRLGKVVTQYAYQIDPLPDATPVGPSGALIGVQSILAAWPGTSTRFLLIERAFVSGHGRRIRIYDANCMDAADVATAESLTTKPMALVRKTLIADLNDLGVAEPDNHNGMTWGPALPNGERVLLLVSGNDFRTELRTKVIALGVRKLD